MPGKKTACSTAEEASEPQEDKQTLGSVHHVAPERHSPKCMDVGRLQTLQEQQTDEVYEHVDDQVYFKLQIDF